MVVRQRNFVVRKELGRNAMWANAVYQGEPHMPRRPRLSVLGRDGATRFDVTYGAQLVSNAGIVSPGPVDSTAPGAPRKSLLCFEDVSGYSFGNVGLEHIDHRSVAPRAATEQLRERIKMTGVNDLA